jgi:hypothetical protein
VKDELKGERAKQEQRGPDQKLKSEAAHYHHEQSSTRRSARQRDSELDERDDGDREIDDSESDDESVDTSYVGFLKELDAHLNNKNVLLPDCDLYKQLTPF